MNTGFFVKVTDVVADVMLTSDRFRFDLKHVLLYLVSIYNVKVLFVWLSATINCHWFLGI